MNTSADGRPRGTGTVLFANKQDAARAIGGCAWCVCVWGGEGGSVCVKVKAHSCLCT